MFEQFVCVIPPIDWSLRACYGPNRPRRDKRMADSAERLQPKQAAEVVGKSTSWLKKKRVTGGGPPWYRIGWRIIYIKSELDAWYRGQRHE